jgi:hypothetical protein
MSIKSLFNNKTTTVENAASGSKLVESKDLVLTTTERDETFYPFINFASASNFAKFGSAEEYYKNSIERIHNNYPYDGSENEKLVFELSSSYLDKYILEQKYPKTNGYVNLSYGGWGVQTSTADGYGLPTSTEYIYLRGGIHVADDMATKPLQKTFDKSVIYDAAKKRVSSLRMNIPQGLTTEFWLKKDAFDLTKTNKEVILDLWNGEISSSVNYGRFTLALSGTTSGTDTFIVTMQSGTVGFFEQSIGTSTVTTSSLSDWHHYALSFVSASTGVTSRLYVDGDLNESKSLGSVGVNEIGGLINGYIGALQTSPSSSQGAATALPFSGKLSASLDDFRYWKTRRTSEEIYNNWYRTIGGGTNTDDANTYLGVYYKFNEGVVGKTATDSVVLDYSGRLVNGSWNGYTAGARSTSSAFVESGLVASEEKDPIIYSTHPEVSSLKTSLMASGATHDNQNTGLLYNKIPQWIRDEDPSNGFSTKYLYQIISSYFDTLHAQITALPSLKNKVYPSSSYKALPFADRLLEEKGLVVPNLFADANVLEAFGSRDLNKIQFEKKLTDIKNQVYTNIYNNLENIYKHKGTEGAIRNMLRCFGIDDEIVKLNIYTDEGTHYFSDAFKHTSENKKYVDFNKLSHLSATLFQTSSANHSLTYISGSGTGKLEQYNALSSEISIIVPKKLGIFDSGHFATPFQSASVFGLHQARPASADYTWATQDLANFQVYLVRDELESPTAKFVLKDYAGNFTLETPAYKQIYSNEQWNLAVRVKPVDYPIAGNVVTSSNRNYQLEFYGVNYAFDTIKNEFTLTQSLNYDTGSAYLSNPKRFYAGAHRINFTGSVLEQTDIKIGRFDLWYDYISDDSVKLHNTDITSRGNRRSSRPSTIFGKDLSQIEVPSYELLTADWDFETVSTSDTSGEFIVVDVSSGSTDSRYGWMDNIIRREHRAKGFGFPVSTTNVVSNEIIYSSKKELPEISYSSDRVTIKGEQQEYFIRDEDVSDNFYSLEKSMYQVISEEMMRNLSTAQEMSNLMGEAVERYRIQYKKLDQVRRLFFEDVEADPDFDRFSDYFKWIDSSVSYMVSQMFPASVRFSKGISDVVESHLFERNKYQNKFPLTSIHTATEGSVKGVGELKYQWQFGHAPLEGGDNNNCLWQKERAERTDIANREDIRKVIVNNNNAQASNVANKDRTSYSGSTYAIRRFTNTYRVGSQISQTIHSGINYNLQKDRDFVWSALHRHSDLTPIGIPKNVLIVGAGTGQGIELPVNTCDDVEIPNEKKKFNTTVFSGKFAVGSPSSTFVPINDSASYDISVKGGLRLPFDIFSGSIATGYNKAVSQGYKSNAVITNLHSDTTSISNDVPLQGPFSQQWVGGHQARHIDLNRYDATLRDDETGTAPPNNLHNLYTRAEAWRILVVEQGVAGSDGAIGMVDPQYGLTLATNTYPDTAKKAATFYRDGRAKRSFNIANIQTTTSSINHGNYYNNYELISAGTGKQQNNLYFRKNSAQSNYLPVSITNELPQTTNPMTLIGQQAASAGNVFGTYENNRQPDGQVIVPAVASAFASGSFVVTGAYVAGTTAGNATFRVHATGSQLKDNEGIRIVDGAGNDKRFFFRTSTPPSDSDPNFYIATGSSNTVFWNNLDSKIQAQTPFAVSFSEVTPGNVESLSLTSSAATPQSVINTGSLPSQYTTNQFSFSGWIDITGSSAQSRDKVIFQFASSSGGVSRELFISSSGDLYYKAISNGASVGTQCIKTQFITNFESTYQTRGLMHLVVSHDYGSGPGSVDFYIDNAAISSTSNNISVGGAGVCGATMALVTPDGTGSILNNNAQNKQFHGTGSNFVFWNIDLSSTHVDYIYNKGHYVNFSTALYCDVSIGNNIIAWFPLEKESSGGTDIISGSNFSVQDDRNNFINTNAGPPALPYANFTLTAPATGSDYNTTLTTSGFGSVATCGTVTNLSNGAGGTNYRGAYPGGSIVLNKTFVMNSTATSPAIAIPQFTGGTNAAFWNALSQSVKDNTVYDNITIDSSAGHQAVFHLTASQTGSAHNITITTSGTNANLTFPGTEVGFAGGINFVSASLSKDITIDRITGSVTRTVITSRFSAPGSIDTLSYGYLDAYSQEYSVYNNVNYRNLSVRGIDVRVSASADGAEFYAFGGSGEATTIRVNNQLNQRDSHKALLSRHCGKYGVDTRNTSYATITNRSLSETNFQTAVNKPSSHKQQRNENRRPSDTSTVLAPVLVKRHDNMYISTPIPRSDFQYTWVTSSLGSNYSITSGKQRMYGYAHPTGILSSSVVIDGDSGFVPAITFPTASEIYGD